MPARAVDAGTVVAQTSPDGRCCAPSPCTELRDAMCDARCGTCTPIVGIARANTLLHTRRCQRGALQAAGISVNNREQPTRLEINTIQPIPVDQRHGTAADLFTVWFGSNLMLLTIITGGLAVTVYGLPFAAAVAGVAIGNLVGAVFMALHAAQGATLGVPQMIQTRGQFGSLGSLLVVGIVIVMYVGFLSSN